MNILFANKLFYCKGGAETVFFQERFFLLGIGHKVIDFSMSDDRNLPSPYSKFFIPKIDYHDKSGIHRKLWQSVSFVHSAVAVKSLERLLSQGKPDIAHLHNIYHQLTPSIIPVLRKHGVKIVLTLHDYKLVCPAYNALNGTLICDECQGKYFWKPFIINCQQSNMRGLLLSVEAFWHKWRKSYDAVDFFIAPSQFLANQIAKRIPPDKIRVLPNGIDTKEYQPNYTDQGYGLYFGRLSREKGVETLLVAHSSITGSLPLKVVGTGPLGEELRASYPRAEFLGYKTGQELSDLVANAAFVVVPSEWHENCSMVILEAMALGKPVIGSRVGGIPEQVEDGKTGFLFKMGDSEDLARMMRELIENPSLRVSMGKAGRAKLVEFYSVDKHGNKLLEIYNSLLP